MAVPLVIIHCRWDFPLNKPSSELGDPHFSSWKSPCAVELFSYLNGGFSLITHRVVAPRNSYLLERIIERAGAWNELKVRV